MTTDKMRKDLELFVSSYRLCPVLQSLADVCSDNARQLELLDAGSYDAELWQRACLDIERTVRRIEAYLWRQV